MNEHRSYTTFHDQALLVHFKGDEDILVEMIGVFIESIQHFITPIREAVIENDQQKLKLYAHNLKGALSNFYAYNAVEMAQEMESLGIAGQFPAALLKLVEIENNLVLLFYELTHFKKNLKGQTLP